MNNILQPFYFILCAMKAVSVPAFKALPVVSELPEPSITEGRVKIKLAAAGLNPFDWKMVDGILKSSMPHVFPMILGVDGAGVVVEAGTGVMRFKKGDRVYGQMLHTPVGEGSYAEYVVVPEDAAIALAPRNIPLVDAAAAPTSGMTALQLLETLGFERGQSLLVVGATGGVGSFVVQLAAAAGIHVIATVSSEEGAARMKKLGAAETVNYKNTDIDVQVDGLIDLASNKEGFRKMKAMAKKALTTMFVADEEESNFESKGTPASLDALRTNIENGTLEIPVDRRIVLEQAPAAIAASRERKSSGKTIIVIDESI